MEKDIASLYKKHFRSKIAIYSIIGLLIILTFCIVILSNQISNQEQAMIYQPKAQETTNQPLPQFDKNYYQLIKKEENGQFDVTYPIESISPNTQIEGKPYPSGNPYPSVAYSSATPIPLQKCIPTPTLLPPLRPTLTGEQEYICIFEKFLPKYPCILGYNASDPVPKSDGCMRRYRPKCRVPGTNREDRTEKPVPPEYKDYCKFIPGEGMVCHFPDSMCVDIMRSSCDENYWRMASKICGCYSCETQGTGSLNGKDIGFGNKYTCSIKCCNGLTRSFDKATGYSQDECDKLANTTCGCK